MTDFYWFLAKSVTIRNTVGIILQSTKILLVPEKYETIFGAFHGGITTYIKRNEAKKQRNYTKKIDNFIKAKEKSPLLQSQYWKMSD